MNTKKGTGGWTGNSEREKAVHEGLQTMRCRLNLGDTNTSIIV